MTGANAAEEDVATLAWFGLDPADRPVRAQADRTAAELLSSLMKGHLRAEDARGVAQAARGPKRCDPLMGIIAASLYDSVGDTLSIKALSGCYERCDQDVPLDVVLLARVPLAMEGGYIVASLPWPPEDVDSAAANLGNRPFSSYGFASRWVRVAGVVPLLRSSWRFLPRTRLAVHTELMQLAGDLTGAWIAGVKGHSAAAALEQIYERRGRGMGVQL
jgi:hypothetical protein